MAILVVAFPHDGLLFGDQIEVPDDQVAQMIVPDSITRLVKYQVLQMGPVAKQAEAPAEKVPVAPKVEEEAPVVEAPVEEVAEDPKPRKKK